MPPKRRWFIVALVATATLAASCGNASIEVSPGDGESTSTSDTENSGVSQSFDVDDIESTPREDVPSALDDRQNPDFPQPLVDPDEIRSGGPPPDGIPPLDDPKFENGGDVRWLSDIEPVLALEINGEARAYPIQVMTWHELVNDAVGDVPVTISYCPLCNSAVAYDRRVGERILDFGTSGKLLNSSLVMYDRQTESLWSHFTGQAIIGHLTGEQLEFFPIQTVSFADFRERYPDGIVLSQDTGFSRRYGVNPYAGYDNPDADPFLYNGPLDSRLAAMTRVISLRGDGPAVVVPLSRLMEEMVVEFEAQGRRLVAVWQPGTASALETSEIRDGRDIGAVGVFTNELDGQPLSLAANDSGFTDEITGATFDIFGYGIGDAEGLHLDAVEHLDTFWFAVAAFDPEVEIAAE